MDKIIEPRYRMSDTGEAYLKSGNISLLPDMTWLLSLPPSHTPHPCHVTLDIHADLLLFLHKHANMVPASQGCQSTNYTRQN